MSPGSMNGVFINFNNTYGGFYYRDSSNTYQWGGASPETLEGLKLYYEAYSSGALNPEFYVMTGSMESDAFRVTGTSASRSAGTVPTALMMDPQMLNRNTGLPYEAYHFATVLGEDGYYHQRDLINFWQVLIFSPDIDMKVFERYMDYLDYTCTDEGYLVQVAGFEGEDYKWENGEMVNLIPSEISFEGREGKYPSAGYLLGCLKLWDDFSFVNPNVWPEARQLSWDMYAKRHELSTPETFAVNDWFLYTYDSPTRRRVAVDYASDFANMVMNAKSVPDLENLYNTWVSEKMQMIKPLLDELTAAYK